MTIAEENAAARAQAGIRSVSQAELHRLTDASPTLTRTRATVAAVSRTSKDVYSNPPDGYRMALDKLAQQKSHPPAPAPASSAAPDGYKIALDKQRKEK